ELAERPDRASASERERSQRIRSPSTSLDQKQIAASWNPHEQAPDDRLNDFRLALGKRLELEMRLAFAEVWHDRAVHHGDTYRFEVMDQSTGEERKISDLDVRRRAAARATRSSDSDHASRDQAIETDLAQHSVTLQQLTEARQIKIAALGKDVGSLRGTLSKVDQGIKKRYEMPSDRQVIPLLARETLLELQKQAVKLNLPDRVSELERLRIALARRYNAPTRTDDEAETLAAQV